MIRSNTRASQGSRAVRNKIAHIRTDLDGMIFNVQTLPSGRDRTDYSDYLMVISNNLWELKRRYSIDYTKYYDTVLVDRLEALQGHLDQLDQDKETSNSIHIERDERLIQRLKSIPGDYVLSLKHSQRFSDRGNDYVAIDGTVLIDYGQELRAILNRILK